jgi:hypothetical protein
MSVQLKLRSEELEWREIDDEIVALDLRTSNYLGVNGTGTAIWPELVAGTTRERLIERLCELFEVEAGVAAADVDAFVEAVRGQGLLAVT